VEHPKQNKLVLVRVDWIDSTQQFGWGEYQETDMLCTSVGILVEKRKDKIVLAQSWSEEQLATYMTIPMVAVLKIRTLK
jgi:hypothetical protein